VTFTHLRGKAYRNLNIGEKLTADPVDAPLVGGAFTPTEFAELRLRGVYYARGAMHYSTKPGTTVSCDVCAANITSEPCISYKTFDVCMACLSGKSEPSEPWSLKPAFLSAVTKTSSPF
jgi:hypothetical protein